jgi:hypothetical protein
LPGFALSFTGGRLGECHGIRDGCEAFSSTWCRRAGDDLLEALAADLLLLGLFVLASLGDLCRVVLVVVLDLDLDLRVALLAAPLAFDLGGPLDFECAASTACGGRNGDPMAAGFACWMAGAGPPCPS